MDESAAVVQTTFRIPGAWTNPGELLERLPTGFRLTPEALVFPDGTRIDFAPMPPDDQFAEIFKSSCRQPASREELAIVDRYTVNVGLIGPGGSRAAARTMMQAGAAIVRAGGAGVFIDNSALAHGGSHWLEMADDGGPDALSFAYVGIVQGRHELWTIGMHVLGLQDVVMRRVDADAEPDAIIDIIRYMASSEQAIGDGHLLADARGPRLQATATAASDVPASSPMYNPFGRLKLVSLKEIAEGN